MQGGADDVVLLPGTVMQQLFKPVMEQILELVRTELDKVKRTGDSCDRLLLVGGFASSPALVLHLRRGLEWQGVDLFVPTHASAAVVKGELAVLTESVALL
jgi:hypothetical protein